MHLVLLITWSFNRTFMELKCVYPHHAYRLVQVLIVPLWNWNKADWSLSKAIYEF